MKRAGLEQMDKRPRSRLSRCIQRLVVSTLIALFGLFCWWHTAVGATIVESGKPLATIVVGEQASPPSHFAAEEFQATIRRMSGAVCPVVTDLEYGIKQGDMPVIAIGSPRENKVAARLLEVDDVDFGRLQLGPDGFLLRSVGRDLVVAGNSGRATLFGVYALLERLGCRWCFPGKFGDVIPQRSTVTLPPLDVVERPAFSYRTFMHTEVVNEKTADWIDWMAKNRMNRFLVTLYAAKGYKGQPYAQFKNTPGLLAAIQKRGLHIEAGHHASYHWIPPREFYKSHPEFFALVNGNRGPVRVEGRRAQLCFSNPQVAQITVDRIVQFAHDNPEADVLSLYTNDGYGYCECGACRALGSKTNAYITYVNRVAERVYKVLPDKKLCFLAYSHVSNPPTGVKVFGKNTMCAVATWAPADTERLKGWLNSGVGEVVLYEYYMGSYSDRSLPGAWPRLIAEELKEIHDLGLAGVASQCELDNWGAYGLNYWVAAKMLWDPTLPLDDVLSDYFGQYYAEAAQPMRGYFDYLESLGRMKRDLDLPPKKLQKLDSLLRAGESAARSEPVRARVARDRVALDYLQKAWAIEEAHRKAQSLAAEGDEQAVVAQLQLSAAACEQCLDYMERHRDTRVFLVGDPDNPQQRVGYFYNTRYYLNWRDKFSEYLRQPEKWIAKYKKHHAEDKDKETTAKTRINTAQKRIKTAFQSFLKKEILKYPPRQIGPDFPRSREQWLAFAADVRQRLRTDVFHFPKEDCPLIARTVGSIDRGDFVIEKVLYRVEPDNWVTANLYLPKNMSAPAPAFICASGHGGSKSASYNQFFGQNYAKAGCVVLIPDPIGEEERDEKYRLGVRGHRLNNRVDRCIALGISTIGKMTYDLVRGIDYLTSRAEVDPGRIGIAGHSLGGTLTEYVTAVDPRVALSLQTAWTPNLQEIVGELSCCWRSPGMLRVANNPELIALGAPHCATLVLAGENDSCPMPVSVFERTTVAKAKQVYDLFGRGDCLAVHVTPQAGHEPFHINRAALAWTEEHFDLPRLTAGDIDRLEAPVEKALLLELKVPFRNRSLVPERVFAAQAVGPEVRILPASMLRCLSPGEQARPQFAMDGWMAARERKLTARFAVPATKHALDARRTELRTKVRELLNLPTMPEVVTAKKIRTFRYGTVSVDELEYGLLGLSSYLIMPDVDESPPVAIVLDRSGTKEGVLESARGKALLAGGTAVLALDALPFLETTFLMGTSPTAYNVAHVMESIDLLVDSYNVDPKQISCIGEVDDVALLAGFLDDRIATVVVASQAGQRKVPRQGYRRTGVVPGLLALTTRTELAAMIAPRTVRITER